tara:strand:- start:62 stop:823 length:762 start_codon:yes stop_codon:yes gene_type:complete
MKILAQFPTLARPEKFLSCLKKYLNSTSGRHSIFFNINCDVDDTTMNNPDIKDMMQEAFHNQVRNNQDKWHDNFCSGAVYFEKHTTKIGAVNANINNVIMEGSTNWDIVIVISDDMIPQVDNWDDYIVTAMMEHYPDLDGCISFDDGYADKCGLITFSILGRKLYDHFGYIYHPDYKSLYCDQEFTEEVKRLDKVTYIDKMIIKHEHYAEEGNSNSGDCDYSAKKTLYFSGRDGQVFEERKKLGFPTERITND